MGVIGEQKEGPRRQGLEEGGFDTIAPDEPLSGKRPCEFPHGINDCVAHRHPHKEEDTGGVLDNDERPVRFQ